MGFYISLTPSPIQNSNHGDKKKQLSFLLSAVLQKTCSVFQISHFTEKETETERVDAICPVSRG